MIWSPNVLVERMVPERRNHTLMAPIINGRKQDQAG